MFRHASPQLAAAARHALYAERMAPSLEAHQRVQAIELTRDMSADARLSIGAAKLEAARTIPLYRALLHLDEESDG